MKQSFRKYMAGVLLSCMFGIAAAGTVLADETVFVQGTSVNGLGIGGMTTGEAAGQISSFYASAYQLEIRERGGVTETISGGDIAFQVGLPEGFLDELLKEQNASGRAYGPDVDNRHRIDMQTSYDKEVLEQRIQELRCIRYADERPTADARISDYEEGKPFVIVPEVIGTSIDREKTISRIREAVERGETELDLAEEGCYIEPSVTQQDAGLQALCAKMNQFPPVRMEYQSDEAGTMTENLEWSEIASWCTGMEDGQIQVDRGAVSAFVKSLADRWDTAGRERTFRTVAGREVILTGPYGWKINQTAETDALISLIQNGTSQKRCPVYAAAGASRTEPDWGTTYVEIDLTGQHVYLIKEGTVVWDAPCVTGNVAKGWATPAGIYSLTYKETNRVLRGEKRADGTYEYESPVSWWMPFNGGIGLHDANWRGSFGGTIYKTGGSHGCVNLPPDRTQALYDQVYKGIPVICYE